MSIGVKSQMTTAPLRCTRGIVGDVIRSEYPEAFCHVQAQRRALRAWGYFGNSGNGAVTSS